MAIKVVLSRVKFISTPYHLFPCVLRLRFLRFKELKPSIEICPAGRANARSAEGRALDGVQRAKAKDFQSVVVATASE
jgi:hypothetical protein